MPIAVFQPFWCAFGNGAVIAVNPRQLAEVDAVGRYILTARDEQQTTAMMLQTLISQHGLQATEATQACQQIALLMQPNPAAAPASALPATMPTTRTTDHRLTINLLGVCIDFHSNCNDSLKMLHALWDSAFHVSAQHSRISLRIDIIRDATAWHLLRDGQPVETMADLPSLKSAIMREALSGLHQTHDWAAVLHAAGVLINDKLVVLAGQSGSGKTTLAAALIAQGAHFFSDDCVPLRADTLLACAAPGSLGIRQAALAGLPSASEQWQPGALSGMPGDLRHHTTPRQMTTTREAAVAALVFPSFSPDADPWIERLDASASLRLLLSNGSGIGELHPDRLASWLNWVLTTPAWLIRYGQTAQGLSYIADILAKSR